MNQLLRTSGAIPYFLVMFLNAFVDLGHKITIQNTIFKIHDGSEQVVLTAIINALILLPFIAFFVPAGQLSDLHAKTRIMRISAFAAIVLTTLITVFYGLGWFWAAFAMTFLLAAQSAFYSPAKIAYIKVMFGKNRLAEANGLAQAATIIAILLGTFAFSILFENFYQPTQEKSAVLQNLLPVGIALILFSLLEFYLACKLPQLERKSHTREAATNSSFDVFSIAAVKQTLAPLLAREVIWLAVVGTAVFWSVGQVMLAAFPAFAKETMGITNTVAIQGVLAASGLGIAIGSTIAGRLSRGYIETGLIPVGALGIAVGLALIPQLQSVSAHVLNYLFIGTMGGLFLVPLNALIQFHAKETEIGKVLASKNLLQNIAMLSFLVMTAAFALLGFASATLLKVVAVVAAIGGLYTVVKLPQSLVRFVVGWVFTRRYRVQVQGLKNLPEQGGVLLLGNHISWIDWALLQIASPRAVRFVMAKDIYAKKPLTWIFKLFGVVPIQSGVSSRDSLNTVAQALNNGDVVCLFPEGTLTRTGHLAEFKKGFERACKDVNDDVVIVPFYLHGIWGSQFSRSSDKLKNQSGKGFKRDILVAFGEPQQPTLTAADVKQKVFELSVDAWSNYASTLPNLAHGWINSAKAHSSKVLISDPISGALSGFKALTGSVLFAKRIKRLSDKKRLGILLPTSAAGMLTNLAGLLAEKTLVNLNYTASESALQSAVAQSDIDTIITSKKFLQKLNKKGIDLSETFSDCQLVYVEELRTTITGGERLFTGLMVKLCPAWLLKLFFARNLRNTDTAAILFSSGSEGAPKGVMLSHENIYTNVKQVADVLNPQQDDAIMASLPLFHAFGLTATQFLPLLEAIPVVCHPDPTDVPNIAKAIARENVTILFGTSTFFRLYVKNSKVHPLMLDSLRFVVAGAEKLKSDVRERFQLKFNKPLFEGYGATETAPVAGVNLPDALDTTFWKLQRGQKTGSIGMALPGTAFKIVDPENMRDLPNGESGMILICGNQVMQGYLNNPEKTENALHLAQGKRWYITGDKGFIDTEGFLTIVDRYSRFAKVGGEMISLSAIENDITYALQTEYPESENGTPLEVCAVSLDDEKKGEKIVLLSTVSIDLSRLKSELIKKNVNPLSIPNDIIVVESIPKLGSGKVSFNEAKHLALTAIQTTL